MKINDYVTRKKYNNDVLFQVIHIDHDVAYLKGINYRLIADAKLSDLKEASLKDDFFSFEGKIEKDILKGKVLHIDGDKQYLEKCMQFYKKNNTPVVGCYLKEKDMEANIFDLLNKHHPDVLVITGHDAYSYKRTNLDDGYLNSKYFINAVKKARDYQPNKDALIIIAGACQSYYEGLISSGANFASSPSKSNIHALDPASIAVAISQINVSEYVKVKDILKNTKSHGLGGIDSKGVARKIYTDK